MKLSFKHSLILAACAVAIFSIKALPFPALRGFQLSMTLALLLLARGGVSHRLGATAAGLLTAILLVAFSGAAPHPVFLGVMLPGMLIDLIVFLLPRTLSSTLLCTAAAGVAGSGPILSALCGQLLTGDHTLTTLQSSIRMHGSHFLFAMFGGLPVPFILKKLKAAGAVPAKIISPSRRKKR